MKLILAFCLLLLPSVAFASPQPTDTDQLYQFLISTLGEKGVLVVSVFCFVGYLWAMVRQMINPERLARLPKWVIDVLEFFAANKGYAKNLEQHDPQFIKRIRPK
ncbi:TPA: hypothetical protein AB5F46_000646 [Vibrio cholerae]|uniref:hypothetical protein n=1 Tax=Vibrio cholerae TaxID=666 RepID=UPI0002C16E41|nr:hypothetical protein [Vibrio cholerae]EMQ69644.1 hypothetical protein VCNHCC008D_001161 [Vibrio cholerae O1 str. NHCC-008D]